MARYDVPRLADYSASIQANNSMVDAFKGLGNQAQDYLKLEEQKRNNEWNKAFEQNKFDYSATRDTIKDNQFEKTFDYGVQRDNVKDNQWQQNFDETVNNNKFDQNYKTNMFNHNVNQDNINNGYKADEMKLKWSNALKPDYTTFNGVDANGNPTLSMIDKNTGKVVNTGQQVYNESKKLAPEQSLYYLDRANEMKQKQLLELEKTFRESNEFSNLNEQDQLKAIDTIRATGKLPQISYDNNWFGKGYYLPMSEAVKQDKQKQLEQDMKALGL